MNRKNWERFFKRTVALVLSAGMASNFLVVKTYAEEPSSIGISDSEPSVEDMSDDDFSVIDSNDDSDYDSDMSASDTSTESVSASDISNDDNSDSNITASDSSAEDDSKIEASEESSDNEDDALQVEVGEEFSVLLNAGDGEFDEGENEILIYVNYGEKYGICHRYLIEEPDEDDETIIVFKDGTPDDYTTFKEYEELPIPELEGYEFIGWNTEEIASEDDEEHFVTSEDEVKIAEDHILYARWSKENGDKDDSAEENTEDIKIDSKEDDETIAKDKTEDSEDVRDNDEATEDENKEASDKDESKASDDDIDTSDESVKDTNEETSEDISEYVYEEDENVDEYDVSEELYEGEEEPYEDEADLITTSNVRSAASVTTYSVTFKLQGGDFANTDSVVFTVSYGTTIEQPEDPTRIKYDFKGWYTSADGSEKFDFSKPIVGDTYIYAQWDAKYKAAAPSVTVFRTRTDNYTGNNLAEDATIQLSSSSYDARIYYIVNPSSANAIPTEKDLLYTNVLTASKLAASDGTITIRAIAIKEGYENSNVSTFVFKVISESDNWGELTAEDRAMYNDPSQIPSGLWIAGVSDKTYTGYAVKFNQDEIRVYDGKKLLTYNVDYTISYKNNTNVGEATIKVSGKANYSGTIQSTFSIEPLNIAGDSFSASDIILKYTGEVQLGTTSLVYYNGSKKVTLKADTDYIYVYPNTDDEAADYDSTAFVGKEDADRNYTVTIIGKGNYTGTRTFTETIVVADKVFISEASATISAINYDARNESGFVCPVPVLRYGGKVLTGYTKDSYEDLSEEEKSQADYTYYYLENDHAGTGYVVFEGRNGFTGTKTSSFTIRGVALKSVSFSGFVDSFTYNGYAQKQDKVVLTYNGVLKEGEDYSVTYQGDTTNVGTVTVIYTGLKGFSGTVKKTYEIAAFDLEADSKNADRKVNVSVLDKDGDSSFAYNKGGVEPLPVVTFNGEVLELDKDYTVRYENNKTVNGSKKPSVIITGKGNYTGSVAAYFAIEGQILSASGIKVDASDKVFENKKANFKTSFSVIDVNGNTLVANTDYDRNVVYSYAENVVLDDGTVKETGDLALDTDIVPVGTIMRITVTGKGYYEGKLSGTYRIVAGDISRASVRVYTQYYTGDEIRPDKSQIEVKLGTSVLSYEDYEILSYSNNVNKGSGTLTIKGVGDYGGFKTVEFVISARTMNYVIIFNGNGSTSGSVRNLTVAAGKTASLNMNRFVRANYVFTGWNTESDGSGTYYADKAQITNDGSIVGVNLILYAQWEPVTYDIVYHLNGGTNNVANTKMSYTAEDPTFTIYAPEKEDWAVGYQFGGWYSDSNFKNRISEIKSGSSGNIDIYAKWIPYTYTVYFLGNGATSGEVTDETFSYGVTKKINANKYKKDGSVFMGWALSKDDADRKLVAFYDEENVVDLISRRNNINGKITLYAVWRDSFEIVYALNGGSLGNVAVPYEYIYGKGVTLPIPSRKGFTFDGWFLDGGSDKSIDSVAGSMSGDLYLYAKWTPFSYTISYDGNGSDEGNVQIQDFTYTSGSGLHANEFIRKGYIFTGWNTLKTPTKNNPGVSYKDMEVVDILPSENNETITLYAQWKATDYSIGYVLNGGSLDVSSDNYITRYEYGHEGGYALPTPVKNGFTFAGWYTDSGYTNKIESIEQSFYGDLTLYALWDATYIVSFDPNGRGGDVLTGTMADQKIRYTASVALHSNAFKSENYAFIGWAVSKEEADCGIVTYTNRQKILRPGDDQLVYNEASNTYTLRLYAVWKNVFTITYELNGGEFLDSDQPINKYSYSKTDSYDLVSPVRDGYTFAGWFKDSALRSKVNNIASNSATDLVLYAKWKSNNYKVTFVSDPPEGRKVTGRMGSQTLQFGVEKKLTKNAYKVAGYSFAGWSTKSSSERTDKDVIIADNQSGYLIHIQIL